MADPIQEQQQQQQQQQVVNEKPVTNAPAPTTTHGRAGGHINDQEVQFWKERGHDLLARPSEHINSRSPAGAQPWYAGFFECFSPVDTCLITCCLPCVTFGQVHHRMQRSAELEGYEPINTSCLLLCGAACVGLACVPVAMQRQMVREKYNLEGSCIGDLARTYCCGCCVLVQNDKEAQHRERLLRQGGGGSGGINEQYAPAPAMAVPGQQV
ncbi:DUF614 domain protein [Cordyceps fumosorosea ARSEF 2679]|uniref:DUF614 domain protein n=1 Tax=Cordyceps fumosorosea (strain ARSEF 2679) TaxID=1081104 RepID=A0A168EES2_CORFA|nr:DUF614 domain protein [Cordyceps fumosorosea ARSEF 2679]OAA73726.1 DUF614 domain protein [Cordyceps fumosorosea ARSEF 2679]